MHSKDIVWLVISLVACEGAGVIGSIFTVRSIPLWYKSLKKPRYTPPNRVFGPVWVLLYLLMGISVFFIWKELDQTTAALPAFVIFWVQLLINTIWSVVFFGYKSIVGGMVLITALWLLILATIISSFSISSISGILLIPYIIWVSIATYLNIGIWYLNRPGNKT
jgi:translocator protein